MPLTPMDLVANILDNKPAEVSAGFHQIMMDKIGAMVDNHKKVVAATLFGGAPLVTPEPEKIDDEETVTTTS